MHTAVIKHSDSAPSTLHRSNRIVTNAGSVVTNNKAVATNSEAVVSDGEAVPNNGKAAAKFVEAIAPPYRHLPQPSLQRPRW